MGRFIIFLLAVMAFSIVAMAVYWIWSRINIDIKRRESAFDIEKETHEKMKKRIKEDKET